MKEECIEGTVDVILAVSFYTSDEFVCFEGEGEVEIYIPCRKN